MKQLMFILLLIPLTLNGYAAVAPYDTWWQKGNQYYQQKQYDSAAYYYEQIAGLKPQNAEVYYNLGTTYYRLNKIGYAVLNLERALHIDPDNKEAAENLVLTQSRIGNHIPVAGEIFFVKWWQALTDSKKAGTWALSSLIVFIALIVILIFKRFRKEQNWIRTQVIGLLGFVWVISLLLSFVSSQNAMFNNSAIVMQNDAPLMNNEQKGKPQSLVPEGTKVELVNEKTGWAEVRLPDGRKGWMQQNLLNKI